jgi:hypothetical protein
VQWQIIAHRSAHAVGCARGRTRQAARGHVRYLTEFLNHQELAMMDAIVLAIGLGFFVLSVGYVYVCDRL